MNDTEEILNAYIEGIATRADAQALLRRLHLTPQERAQVELTLRLADDITAAVDAAPSAAFETRLRQTLQAQMNQPEAQIDESVAQRLLNPAPRATGTLQHPDVLAASDEPPTDDQ